MRRGRAPTASTRPGEQGENEALKTFLINKLDTFRKEDATQVTLLCTWLVEIFLNKLNDAREHKDDDEYKALQQEFFEFLSTDVVKVPVEGVLALPPAHGGAAGRGSGGGRRNSADQRLRL